MQDSETLQSGARRFDQPGLKRIQFLKGAQVAPPKEGRSRKTSWDSQEKWNRDKPTVKWACPFILSIKTAMAESTPRNTGPFKTTRRSTPIGSGRRVENLGFRSAHD